MTEEMEGLVARPRSHEAVIAPINYPITRLSNYQIAKESGFTLIELMVVVTLLVMLASAGIVQYRHAVVLASEATLRDDLFKMRSAINQYYTDRNKYPPTLDALVTEGYIRAIVPDPFTKSSSTWQTIESPPDPNNFTAAVGVYDVKSGATGSSLAGSRYSEW